MSENGAALDVVCVICEVPGSRLCSPVCLDVAVQERDRNVARQHQLGASDEELRTQLSRRNGALVAALIAWRPQSVDADHHADHH